MIQNVFSLLSKRAWIQLFFFIFILVLLAVFGGGYFWREIWFLLELFVLTFFTRSVLWKTNLSVFFKGLYLGCLLTLLANGLIAWIVPSRDNSVFFNGFVVALTEEFFKFAPVLLVAFIFARKKKIHLNLSDWVWLSVVSGAAFSMAEKVLFINVNFPFTYGPHILGLPFFSDALGVYAHGEKFGYIGHAAATGLIGLTMGLGLLLKTKSKIIKPFWWALPVLGYVWIVLEHALNNAQNISNSRAVLWLGGGQITPWIFLILLAIVLLWDMTRLFAFLKKQSQLRTFFKEELKRIRTLFRESKLNAIKALLRQIRVWRAFNAAAVYSDINSVQTKTEYN